MLKDLPVHSVKVLSTGTITKLEKLVGMIGDSYFIRPGHIEELSRRVGAMNLDITKAVKETDHSRLMEGLYVKIEEDGIVKGRFKYIRPSFLQAVFAAEGHWLNRPIIPNLVTGDDRW